ncbi:DUF6493 family protein [Streptomyces sp. NPDC059982]|uniref:DUF6493 family protein n=1 Tax=unclassified Streptomyces TaxID=2593676 RepID=UPI00367409D7
MTSPLDVLTAVRAGHTRRLPALLAPLDRAQRSELLAGLKELRAGLRASGWERRQEREMVSPALLVAGAACQTGAAAAASWIGGRDMRRRRAALDSDLVEVLAHREPRWLGDLAHRLAARPATAQEDYPLIEELVRRAGCPMPTSDGCVEGWATAVWSERGTLTDALRRDPHLAVFVPRLFETPEPVTTFAWHSEPQAQHHWPATLARLAADGLLERTALLDACTDRLVRGGTALHLKPYRSVLEALRPTLEEERERTADWIALTADAASPVAGHAQEVLARLATAGHLTPALLAEMSAAVFFRPEKKLVRAQLALLGKVLARDPDAAPELLPVLGEAFGHPDTDIQERALKLAAAHLGDDRALRAELADRAHLLSPVHRARAVALLGADAAPEEDTGPYREMLPPPPPSTPLGPSPESVEETVELVAAAVNSRTESVEDFERALDGLVRHAHRDRAALAAALRPALADRYWLDPARSHLHHGDLPGLEHVAAAVLDVRPSGPKPQALVSWRSDCHHSDAAAARHARVAEAARGITAGPPPFLLATPTLTDGSLDPHVLVSRLGAYARLGVTPGPVDFAQALLRVHRDPSVLPGAAALGTREGDRLVAWIGGAGRPAAVTRRTAPAEHHRYGGHPDRPVLDTGERPVLLAEFPAAFRELGQARRAVGRCWDAGAPETLIALLPQDRDALAAWSLPAVIACALDDERGGTDILPGLAAAGPGGPALHLAIATGLGARHAQDRLRSVDALLTLAGRGELDTVRLGADLAELLELGTLKPSRLADALRTAAATGAHATTWAVLAQVLPALLTGSADPRGTGELLETAAVCAEHSRAVTQEPPAGLDAAASRPGRSRLITQAARLRDALHRNREAMAADAR